MKKLATIKCGCDYDNCDAIIDIVYDADNEIVLAVNNDHAQTYLICEHVIDESNALTRIVALYHPAEWDLQITREAGCEVQS